MRDVILIVALVTATTLSWDQIRQAVVIESREEFVMPTGPAPTIKPSKCAPGNLPTNLKVFRNGLLQTSPDDYTLDTATCEIKMSVTVATDRVTLIYQ